MVERSPRMQETKIIITRRRWENFHSVLAEGTKAGGVTPQHPLFVAIDNLLANRYRLKIRSYPSALRDP